jgi:hypothetical protein
MWTIHRLKDVLPDVPVYNHTTRQTLTGTVKGRQLRFPRVIVTLPCGTEVSFEVSWECLQRVLNTGSAVVY